jgi:UDP-glucuronate 4-epimerase
VTRHVLLTGGAGFIGSHLTDALLRDGWRVTAVDNFDPFYPREVKERNVAPFRDDPAYTLVEADIRDGATLRNELTGDYDVIVHLAALAGVRPSIERPLVYDDVNVHGTHELLALAREWRTPQFVFGSSSSVYGVNPNLPWREDDTGLAPISPYASTKIAGELMGHTYSHLFGIRFVALRFFTVYGPRQRPDLAIHAFARRILRGEPLPLFGDGSSMRDYTYVDDIVAGIRAAMSYDASPYAIFNLGNGSPVTLLQLVQGLEHALGRTARTVRLPDQPGDVPSTWADISRARDALGYAPATPLTQGLARFAEWVQQTG